jgi:hypothetical protein
MPANQGIGFVVFLANGTNVASRIHDQYSKTKRFCANNISPTSYPGKLETSTKWALLFQICKSFKPQKHQAASRERHRDHPSFYAYIE